jgi:glucose dehydrogenase
VGALLTVLCVCAGPAAGAAAPCTASTTGGDWPMYGHDLANTRTQTDEHGLGPTAAANLTPAWVFSTGSTGDGSQLTTTPVVSDGCVFIGSFNGYVYGLDASTGHAVWQRKLDAPDPGSGGVIVGAAAVYGREVIFLINEFNAPYAIALDRSTGAVIWRSAAFAPQLSTSAAQAGSYTNASPIIANGFVVAGYSPPEGDSTAAGGFSLIDAATGALVKTTPTVSPADQANGYSGGGLWSTPAYDPSTGYLYWGAGNPSSKDKQDPNTDAILKIDLDRARSTFAQIVGAYPGNVDQYASALQALTQTPACQVSADPSVPIRSSTRCAASSTSTSVPRRTCSRRAEAPNSSATSRSRASTTWPTRPP